MPSYKKMLRLAAERAKLREEAAKAAVSSGQTGGPMDAQVANNVAVAVDFLTTNAPIFENNPKKADSEVEEGVSGISGEPANGAILSQETAHLGNDATTLPDARKSEGMAIGDPVPCRVYGKPVNPRIRFIEFDDGSHGRMWVHQKAAPMIGWTVWVVPYVDVPGDWVMHGRYNSMGVRRS